jgi:hypothetical protein
MKMQSVFIPLNVKNRNGRIYTKENIEPYVDDFLSRKNQIGVCYGEFDHPDSFDISLSKISHTIENIWFEGNKLMGEIKPLNTHWGKKLKEWIDSGVKFSVRPRSTGFVDPYGYVHLKKLFTFDIIPLESDSFNDLKIIRKMKLDKLAEIEKSGILSEYYIEDEDEKLPKLDDDFHILKNNELIND